MFEIRPFSLSVLTRPVGCPCLVCLCLGAGLSPAAAYRPFDGTDAAVADKDTLEIELQPAGVQGCFRNDAARAGHALQLWLRGGVGSRSGRSN